MSTPETTATPPATTAASATPAASSSAPAATQESPKKKYADWPQKNDERDQPWDLKNISREDRDKLLDNPGSPNKVSPIVISHSMPILSSGSGGDVSWAVNELGRRLGVLGYDHSISDGRNPFSTMDQSLMGAIERFRQDYNVLEDPSAFGGDTNAGRSRANDHVGPWTWEALLRASERELAKA